MSRPPRTHGPPTSPIPWRERLLVLLLGCVLTAILTYPTIRYFGSAGRFDTGDGRFSIWNVAWVAHALLDDPRHVLDANIFHPHRYTLAYSELNLVAGAMATPAYAITRNPIAAHNSAVAGGLLLAFVLMWLLVRKLTGSFWAAVVAATGYTFSAFTSSHTAEIQLLMIFGFPLVLLALHRLAERPGPLAGVLLGMALSLAALASGYFGVFAAGVTGLMALLFARPVRAYWIGLAIAALTTALVVGPVMLIYGRVRAAEGAQRTTTIDELQFYSANTADYLTTGAFVSAKAVQAGEWVTHTLYPRAALGPSNEVLFPGVVIGLFAIVGCAAGLIWPETRRATFGYTALAIVSVWASFGPRAKLYLVLMKLLPGMSLLRAPARLGIVVTFALAVIAGVGFAALFRQRRLAGPVCVALLVVELWVPWPLQGWPAEPQAYQMLRTLPRGGVVEFPFPYVSTDFHRHTQAMVRSMRNWQPLLNGYSDYVPPDFAALALPVNGFPNAESFAILRSHDIRYVVLRVSDYGTGEYRRALLDRFPPYDRYLRRLTTDQDVWLYEIVGWPEGSQRR